MVADLNVNCSYQCYETVVKQFQKNGVIQDGCQTIFTEYWKMIEFKIVETL